MSTYEPGTVAIATVRGVPNVRVMRVHSNLSSAEWASADGPGPRLSEPRDVTDVRPLIVLDTFDLGWGSAAHVVQCLREHDRPSCDLFDRLALQIEQQTMPPRIPEPYWGAIVREGQRGDRWIRSDKGWTNLDAVGPYLNWSNWEDFENPVLIRDGIEATS